MGKKQTTTIEATATTVDTAALLLQMQERMAKQDEMIEALKQQAEAAKLEAEIAKQKAAVLGQEMPYRAYLNTDKQQIHVTLPAKLVFSPRVAQIADPHTGNVASKIVGYDLQIMLVDRNRSTTPTLTAKQQAAIIAAGEACGIPSLANPDALTRFASLLPKWAPKGKDEAIAASNAIKTAFDSAPGAAQSHNAKLISQ